MTTPGGEDRDTAATRAPGAIHVPVRAAGRCPEWGSRLLRQQKIAEQQQEPPQRARSIITMRHVRQHLPVVEGELMTALEEEEEQEANNRSINLNDEAAYEEVEFEISDRSSGSTNLSIGNMSDASSSAKEAKLGTAKAFLQGGLSKMSRKNRKSAGGKQKQQESSPSQVNRRKILREKLLAQPSLLLPPAQAESLRLAVSRDVGSGGNSGRGTLRPSGGRPSLERNRNARRLPSQAAIPEDRSADLREEVVTDISFTSALPDTVFVVEEEASEAVIVLDHILEIFPDANPNDACRWVAEGRSVRNILGELCHARRTPLRTSTLSELSEEQFEELDAVSLEPHSAEKDAIDEDAEISEMVRQIQEFFPGVNVDRSYAMLRDMSLQEVMTELAEESLNSSADFNADNSDDSRGVDETTLQHAQEVFPHVEREELKVLLRDKSLSGVMLQLLDGPLSPRE